MSKKCFSFLLFFQLFLIVDLTFAGNNDSLIKDKNSISIGIMTSTLPKVIPVGAIFPYSTSCIPDEKDYFGYGIYLSKSFKVNNHFSFNASYSFILGKLSYTYYYYVYLDSMIKTGNEFNRISYILNSFILDYGYNINCCENDQNILFNAGLSVNHRKSYKSNALNTNVESYFERYLNSRYLSISPKISIRYEKKIKNKYLFIENECFLYMSDLFYGTLKTNYFFNRLIFGLKI